MDYQGDGPLTPEILFSMLESISVGLMFENTEGKIVFVNKQFTEMIGYSKEELVNLTHQQAVDLLVGASEYQEIKANLDKTLQGNQVSKKRNFIHKKGYKVPLEVYSFPIYSKKQICGNLLELHDLHQDLMVKISSYVNSTLSLEEVLHNTVNSTVENLGLSSTAVFLMNEEQTEVQLICCNAVGADADMSRARFKIGEGPPGKIVQLKKPVYVRNLRTEPGIDEYMRKFHGDKSSIGYPLVCKGELMGAIAFDADTIRSFSEKEKLLFQSIADQVAFAIYNAKLFSRLEHLSSTDGLTGLHNHRYFKQVLRNEISRAAEGTSLGVLMLDADHFKTYNDRFGHLLGDKLLKELAQVIGSNVRNCDTVARYGGEEFGIILPNCSQQAAVSIAQRIRRAVEEHNFLMGSNEPVHGMTVSIGLAMYPDETNKDKLLLNADKALYKAKQLGRNRVVVHKQQGMYAI